MKKNKLFRRRMLSIVLAILTAYFATCFNNIVFADSTMSVNFPESTLQNQSKTVAIQGVGSVYGITTDNGSVSYSMGTNSVTVSVLNGAAHRIPSDAGTSKTIKQTNTVNSFSSTYNYDDGTYFGTLSKSGSATYGIISSSTLTPTDSRTSTNPNSFPTSLSYNQNGYVGTLNKSGSPVVISGSPAGSKSVSDGPYSYTVEDYCNWNGSQMNYQYSTGMLPSTKPYNDGTYSGTLTLSSYETSGVLTNYAYYDWDKAQRLPVPSGPYNTKHHYMSGTYSGTFSKPDTRVYTQYYSGTVVNNVYGYTQTYTGTVYRKYYTYNVNFNYIVYPSLNKPTIAGTGYYGDPATVSATGTNISQSSYRIFYTTALTAPTITNGNTPGVGWIDSGITGVMNITGGTSVSQVIAGSNLSDPSWTYITVKVAAGSTTNNWVTPPQYTAVYVLSAPPNNVDDYIRYVGHNQILSILGTGSKIPVSDPNTPVQEYGPYNTSDLSRISNSNVFINGDYVTYRLEFDVANSNKINDIKVLLDFNAYNVDSLGLNLDTSTVQLQKQQANGSFANIKNLSSLVTKLRGKNRYTVKLGNDNLGNPIIKANGTGRYAILYNGKISNPLNLNTTAQMTNEAQITLYTTTLTYPFMISPERLGRKNYIDTNVSEKNVVYQ